MQGKKRDSIKSKFTALENHFLNTYFSGIYIGASELIEVGSKVGLSLDMNSRELLIKELLNKSDSEDRLSESIMHLNTLLSKRIEEYNRLSRDYPGAASALAQLAQKTAATKSLLSRETQGGVYER